MRGTPDPFIYPLVAPQAQNRVGVNADGAEIEVLWRAQVANGVI